MAARLWFIGSLLVALGFAAKVLGWETLLWFPQRIVEAVRDDPATTGIITLGVILMFAARLIGRRRD